MRSVRAGIGSSRRGLFRRPIWPLLTHSAPVRTGRVEYLGLVQNGADCLVGISPLEGLTFERWTKKELGAYLQSGHMMSEIAAELVGHICVPATTDAKAFVLRGRFPCRTKKGVHELPAAEDLSRLMAFTHDVGRVVTLLRLFGKGRIGIRAHSFAHEVDGHRLVPLMGTGCPGNQSEQDPYDIGHRSVLQLREFLCNASVEGLPEYVQLAVAQYEVSFEVDRYALQFLTLMIALEVLLNQGVGEVVYRICRGVAALLATDKKTFTDTFERMKKFYEMRSRIVHGGRMGAITREDAREVREVVRRSLLRLLEVGWSKRELSERLNCMGCEQLIGARGKDVSAVSLGEGTTPSEG